MFFIYYGELIRIFSDFEKGYCVLLLGILLKSHFSIWPFLNSARRRKSWRSLSVFSGCYPLSKVEIWSSGIDNISKGSIIPTVVLSNLRYRSVCHAFTCAIAFILVGYALIHIMHFCISISCINLMWICKLYWEVYHYPHVSHIFVFCFPLWIYS